MRTLVKHWWTFLSMWCDFTDQKTHQIDLKIIGRVADNENDHKLQPEYIVESPHNCFQQYPIRRHYIMYKMMHSISRMSHCKHHIASMNRLIQNICDLVSLTRNKMVLTRCHSPANRQRELYHHFSKCCDWHQVRLLTDTEDKTMNKHGDQKSAVK